MDLLAVWVHGVGSEKVSFEYVCLHGLTKPMVLHFGPSKKVKYVFMIFDDT